MTAPGAPPHATRCLKREGRRRVWRVEAPGSVPTVVKVWPLDVALVLKMLLGMAQPQRLRRDAERLRAARLPTPRVQRIWRVGRDERGRVIALEMDWVPGESGLAALQAAHDAPQRGPLIGAARQAGAIVAAHAAHGLVNRDLKLTNLLVDRSSPESAVQVIDPDLRRSWSRPAAVARMLERLNIEPADFGVSVPWAIRRAVVRAATDDLGRRGRRAALRMLRSRRPR